MRLASLIVITALAITGCGDKKLRPGQKVLILFDNGSNRTAWVVKHSGDVVEVSFQEFMLKFPPSTTRAYPVESVRSYSD